MANARKDEEDPKRHRIFAYGTLKKGLPNHNLMQDLADENDAVYLGKYSTKSPFPLVLGIYGIPYLINLPGSGRPVRGELYAVSDRGLARIDDLEATAVAHYDRLPVQVVCGGDAAAAVEAECYFAGRGFGEGLWVGKGVEGLEEYTEREAVEYVRKDQRSKDFPWF